MQPTSRGNPRGTKKKTCGTRRTRRTRGSHPEAHPEATRKSPRTHSTNVQRAIRPALLLPGRWRWWRTSLRHWMGWWEYWRWWVPRRWRWLQHYLRWRIRGWRRIIRGPVPVRVGPIREAPGARGISGSDFIGGYLYRGSYSYRGSYGYPCCCGYPYSSQVVCRTCRARKTGRTWEGKSRGSHRIERADRVERVGRPKQTGGNSRGK